MPSKFEIMMIKRSGRAWWEARYYGGKIVAEWDTFEHAPILLPLAHVKTSRWEELDKKLLAGLRLLCPNGMAGELDKPPFFQLKVGFQFVGMGGGGSGRSCSAQIIGSIISQDGSCECHAWNTATGALESFKDNVFDFKYQNIGRLNLAVQGIHGFDKTSG